jgi:hypothetical protein
MTDVKCRTVLAKVTGEHAFTIKYKFEGNKEYTLQATVNICDYYALEPNPGS